MSSMTHIHQDKRKQDEELLQQTDMYSPLEFLLQIFSSHSEREDWNIY